MTIVESTETSMSYPTAPLTIAESGLAQDFVSNLILKHLHVGSKRPAADGAAPGARYSVIDPRSSF